MLQLVLIMINKSNSSAEQTEIDLENLVYCIDRIKWEEKKKRENKIPKMKCCVDNRK